MGYTHYIRRKTNLDPKRFAAAAEDCRLVCHALTSKYSFPIQFESDNQAPPVFAPDQIRFNGVGEDAHETFYIDQKMEPDDWQKPDEKDRFFEFCKTARKPYDAAVCACLIVLKKHLGGQIVVSSDGEDGDEGWERAKLACQEVLGFGGDFMVSIPTRFTKNGIAIERETKEYWESPSVATTRYKTDSYVHVLVRYHRVWQAPNRKRWGVLRRSNPDFEFQCETKQQAQWFVTMEFLKEQFKDAPRMGEFVAAAAEDVGEWTGLYAWADLLDEHTPPAGKLLRLYLPRLRRVPVAA